MYHLFQTQSQFKGIKQSKTWEDFRCTGFNFSMSNLSDFCNLPPHLKRMGQRQEFFSMDLMDISIEPTLRFLFSPRGFPAEWITHIIYPKKPHVISGNLILTSSPIVTFYDDQVYKL